MTFGVQERTESSALILNFLTVHRKFTKKSQNGKKKFIKIMDEIIDYEFFKR